jgi:uncharacterized protein (DUF2225 family)
VFALPYQSSKYTVENEMVESEMVQSEMLIPDHIKNVKICYIISLYYFGGNQKATKCCRNRLRRQRGGKDNKSPRKQKLAAACADAVGAL